MAIVVPAAITHGVLRAQTRDTRADSISTGRIVTATAVTATVGLGIGHFILDYDREGRIFLFTQLGAEAGAISGWAIAVCPAGEECTARNHAGEAIFWASFALYVGSRIYEVVDVVARPVRRNGRLRSAPPQRAPPAPEWQLTPLVLSGHPGLAVAVRF